MLTMQFLLLWLGNLYEFNVLPMGLSSSPRIITKVMKPPLAYLRQTGRTVSGYIDDFFIQGNDFRECYSSLEEAVLLFLQLGFHIHPEKSVLIPSQSLTFLGFNLNPVSLCTEPVNGEDWSTRLVAKVIGKVVSALPGVEFGRLHHRYLERDKIYALSAKQEYYDALMQLSPAAKEELKWWCDNVGHGYRRIQHATYSNSFQVDASDSGWCIACTTDESLHSHGFWSQEQRSLHINFDPTLLGESGPRPSGRSVSGVSMAHSNVVHQNCTDVNQPAGGDGLDERDESANTPIGSTDSQRARLFDFDGLLGIRRYYQMQGFSEHIIITDVLVNSWRPATQKHYKVYIKKWAIFCGIRKIAPDLSQI